MAKPISKKAAMDDAVKGMNMKELTEKMADPKTPAPIKAAAKRRLDRISGADKTAPLSQMSKGGKATKKVPVISIGVGMAEMKEDKKKYAKGGYANCGASMPATQDSSRKMMGGGYATKKKY